jgi:hypothetical protein
MSTEGIRLSRLETRQTTETETVEQFLARGGRIERIEEHPDPEGRVLRRGQRTDASRRGAVHLAVETDDHLAP